jgi:hypothetical protein
VLTNAKPGDTLSVNGGSLDVDVDNSVPGQITLTVSAAGFNAPSDATLRSISFGNANANVDPTSRNITVTVSDENNSSIAAHSTVTIAGATNDPGVAFDDTAATAGNTTLSVAAAQGVLANDNDPDGLTVITGTVATSQGGTIQFAADGSYVYTPAAFFVGTDTVGYTAQDPFGSQVSATLHIDVGAAPGTAGDDSYTAHRRAVEPHGVERLRALRVHRRHRGQPRRQSAGRRPVLFCAQPRRLERACRSGSAL